MKELNLFDNEGTAPIIREIDSRTERINTLKNTPHNLWNDPGHGWLEVRISDLKLLGIDKKVSGYSYRDPDGERAYLEEDCDMSLYIDTLYESDPVPANAQNWCNTMLIDKYKEHIFIRSLRHY